jgi:glycosyltransferase involved in cell wall biosynthesis
MNAPRVLIAHAYYRQRGGEDVVVEQEAALLEDRGHAVARLTVSNHDIDETRRAITAFKTLWSAQANAELARLIATFQPDVIHVHNTFPSLSPSIYWTAASHRIPLVQTLHNFRLLCPQAMLLRDGNVCEDCVGHIPWRAVVHGCYRDSSAQSAVSAGVLMLHRSLGTFRHKITRYIALNEFCRRKFIAGGLAENRIMVKPNFADVPKPDEPTLRRGALFAGRIAAEKGIHVLLDALELLPQLPVQVVGAGPELGRVALHANITVRGWLEQSDLYATMRRCAYLVLPSIWYENSPRVLIEAFGCGLPVIASRLGALAELVDDHKTGLLFDPTSASGLATAIRWAERHPREMRAMGQQARRVYENLYSPDRNHQLLVDVYREAIASSVTEKVA